MSNNQVREAVIRLMQEIVGFTDRPDYSKPESVDAAFKVLYESFEIDQQHIYQTYCAALQKDDDECED